MKAQPSWPFDYEYGQGQKRLAKSIYLSDVNHTQNPEALEMFLEALPLALLLNISALVSPSPPWFRLRQTFFGLGVLTIIRNSAAIFPTKSVQGPQRAYAWLRGRRGGISALNFYSR